MVGAQNRSCIGTLVERHTGYMVLSKMDSKKAIDIRQGFSLQMHYLPGLLRQYFPKGTDLSVYSQEHLNKVAILLNGRPQKWFDWKSP